MDDVIIYYRSRPSEPEASEVAMRLQRADVQAQVEAGRIRVVAEVVEEESEATDQELRQWHRDFWDAVLAGDLDLFWKVRLQARPGLDAAVAASEAYGSTEIVVVSDAAIGSGETFKPANLNWGGANVRCWHGRTVETPEEIELPPGAPGRLSLYLLPRPGQLDELYYLCNAGRTPLLDVMVVADSIIRFRGTVRSRLRMRPLKLRARWRKETDCIVRRCSILPPGRGILIGGDDEVFGGETIDRYWMSFTTARGRRQSVRVTDLGAGSKGGWLKLKPRRRSDHPRTGGWSREDG